MPGEPFHAQVQSEEEGHRLLEALALYDLYQLKNKIKPDFANTGGLERFESGCWFAVDDFG